MADDPGLNRPPKNFQLRQMPWTPGLPPTWSPSRIRAALREHEMGRFSSSALLVDAMGRDDRLNGIARTRTRGLLGLPFSLPAADDSDPKAVAFARRWSKLWPRFAKASDLSTLLHWYVMLGVAVAQIWWEKIERGGKVSWEPRLQPEHPSFLSWNETTRRYSYETEGGSVDIQPGDGRWVILESGERGFMNGAIRWAAILWYIREQAWLDWARYCERHGLPVLKAKMPSGISDPVRDAFWGDVQELGRETSVLLPQGFGEDGKLGFDLELLEAQDGSWEAFEALQKRIDTCFAVGMLGQNLTTEVDVAQGSYAAARVHAAVQLQTLQSDENEFGDDLHQQAIIPVSRLLEQAADAYAPRPTWDVEPPQNIESRAKTIAVVADAAQRLTAMGAKVDVGRLTEEFGLPIDVASILGQQLFQYHLNFGILTINEARARLGLPPIKGGDERPVPIDVPAEELSDRPSPSHAVALNETIADVDLPGDEQFNLEVSEVGALSGGRNLDIVSEIDEIVATSESYSEVETRLIDAYRASSTDQLQEILKQATRIAALNGLLSVAEELGDG